ncbi:MAG: hypothetical protein IT371_30860 [Deltaproteobacteria bacterium]|nr:hypothetical protein [Deltaproteobacteria bacterium]
MALTSESVLTCACQDVARCYVDFFPEERTTIACEACRAAQASPRTPAEKALADAYGSKAYSGVRDPASIPPYVIGPFTRPEPAPSLGFSEAWWTVGEIAPGVYAIPPRSEHFDRFTHLAGLGLAVYCFSFDDAAEHARESGKPLCDCRWFGRWHGNKVVWDSVSFLRHPTPMDMTRPPEAEEAR